VSCHILGNRGLTHIDAELEEFAMDPGSAPKAGWRDSSPRSIDEFRAWSTLLKTSRFGAFLRSTLSCGCSATISASREDRDRKNQETTHQISLSKSRIGPSIARFAAASGIEFTVGTRTHLSLNKDAPVPRAIQTVGRIYASPIVGGLHHQYVRI
jgi:hypothetical protein